MPPIASVGLNESQAKQQGLKVRVADGVDLDQIAGLNPACGWPLSGEVLAGCIVGWPA